MTLIILTFLFYQSAISIFTNYSTILPGSQTDRLGISPDGNIIAQANALFQIKIQERVGLDFQFSQLISGSNETVDFFFTMTNKFMIVTRKNSVEIYQRVNTSYQIFQIINQADILRSVMSEDYNNVVLVSKASYPRNYILNAGQYAFEATLQESTQRISDIKIAEDSSWMVSGGSEQIVFIYNRNSEYKWVKFKQFTVPTQIIELSVLNNLEAIMVAGFQLQIYVYFMDSNGDYILQRNMSLSSAPIARLITSVDWKTVACFARNSATIHIFKYDETSKLFSADQDIVNPDPQAFLDIGLNRYGMQLIYSSPSYIKYSSQCRVQNCAICETDNVCNQCQSGYFLEVTNQSCIFISPTNSTNQTMNSTNNETTANQTVNQTANQTINQTANQTVNQTDNQTSPIEFEPTVEKDDSSGKDKYTRVCLDNVESIDQCQDYCSFGCSSCEITVQHCLSCIDQFMLGQKNKCQLESTSLDTFGMLYSGLSFLRFNKFKSLFYIIDDLWLYQFQKEDYKMTPKQIFDMVNIIETMKDKAINLGRFQEKIQQTVIKYNQFANQKYLYIARKDDSLLGSQLDFFLQSLPIGLLIFLIGRFIFHMLFHNSLSVYLRAMSFNGYFLVMVLQGEIQEITYLAFRNFRYLFALDFSYKLNSIFVVLFFFIVVMYVFAGYFLFRIQYKKLFKYFLDNLKTQDISLVVMMALYGVRPFLRGIIHSILYQNPILQLKLLFSVDFCVIVLLAVLQGTKRVFINKTAYFCLTVYLGSGMLLNVLFGLHIENKQSGEMMQIIDKGIRLLLYIRLGSSILQIIFSILNLQPSVKIKKEEMEELDENQKNQEILQEQKQRKSFRPLRTQINQPEPEPPQSSQKQNPNHQIVYEVLFDQAKRQMAALGQLPPHFNIQ